MSMCNDYLSLASSDEEAQQRALEFEFYASQFDFESKQENFDVCDFAKESVAFDLSKEVF
jgi:hypothetical protein